jgi:preprotein translocase subunit SecF
MLDLVGKRYIWFALSLLLIVPGLIFLIIPGGGLRVGVDFSGGTLWEFSVPQKKPEVTTDAVAEVFRQHDLDALVQLSPPDNEGRMLATIRTSEVGSEDSLKQQIEASMKRTFPSAELTRFEAVGETVSRESTQQAILAVVAASLAILGYLTYAFRGAPHPFRYGICAILAMLHDVLVVLGAAAILGYFIGLEVDALFLTALLTVISFSVHDTIVVFDRLRENLRYRRAGQRFEEVVNLSIVQTLSRSINTQLTTFFTLMALLLFGGPTIRDFILILLIGLLSGTYSSIFNAAQLLVVWENGWANDWRRVFGRERQHPGPAAA